MREILQISKRMLIIGTLFLIFTHDVFAHTHTDQDYSEQASDPNSLIEWIIGFFDDNHDSSSLEDYRLRYDCCDDIDLDIDDSEFSIFYLTVPKPNRILLPKISLEFQVLNFSYKNKPIRSSFYGRAPPVLNFL